MPTWTEWKHAMAAYGDRFGVPVPEHFAKTSNRCGHACQAFLEAIQHHSGLTADGILGPDTRSLLRPLLAGETSRERVVDWGRFGCANNAALHYAEVRPFPLTPRLPLWTDCSGFYALCCHLAGAPDPTGNHFSGYGNTDSCYAHMAQVAKADLKPGDAVIWGTYPETTHMAMIAEPGDDPLIITHGSEGQPQEYRQSVENPYHPGQPYHYRRLALH